MLTYVHPWQQGWRQLFWARGSKIFPSLPTPSLPPSLPLPPPFSLSPPLPQIQLGGMGERCKLPQQVRAEPGCETGFGAFWTKNNASCDIKFEEFSMKKMLLRDWISMSSLPVCPFPFTNQAEDMGIAVSLLVHFGLSEFPWWYYFGHSLSMSSIQLHILIQAASFFKLYQEVMGRSKLYSVDYVGAHRHFSAYKNAHN